MSVVLRRTAAVAAATLVLFLAPGRPAAAQTPEASLVERLAALDPDARARELRESTVVVSAALETAAVTRAQALFDAPDYPAAVAAHEVVIAIASRLGHTLRVAQSYRAMGLAVYRLGRAKDALAYYERGLPLAEQEGNKALLADLLRGIGVSARALGDPDRAFDAAQRSLALSREIGDVKSVLGMLGNLATLHLDAGDTAKNIELLQESSRVAAAAGLHGAVLDAYDNLGVAYMSQGDHEVGLQYLEKVLAERLAAKDDDRAISGTEANIAVVYEQLGRHRESREAYADGLMRARRAADERRIAILLSNRGTALRREGQYQQALLDLTEALAIYDRLGIQREISEPMTEVSRAKLALGDPEAALDVASRALAQARRIRIPAFIAQALEPLGDAHLRLGHRQEARAAYEEQIAIIEDLRQHLGGGRQQRNEFFDGWLTPYHELIALDVEDGRPLDALKASEQVRARQLMDILRSGPGRINKAMTPEETARERDLSRDIARLDAQLVREGLPADQVERLRGERVAATRALDLFHAELYAAHPELQLQRADMPPLSLAEAGDLLPDAQTAIVEYAVTRTATFVFVLTRGADGEPSLAVRRIAWTRGELEAAVEAFASDIAAHKLAYRAAASALFTRLVGPIDALLAGRRLLVIVPDGALWDLPFQALVDSRGRHLIERQALFYAPSMTTLREARRVRSTAVPNSAPTLLAVGDPDLSGAPQKWAPLPQAGLDVRALGREYGESRSRVLTDAAASESAWKRDAPSYRVLHLATHGVLDARRPMSSYLLLTPGPAAADDGRLEAGEIMELNLHADLTVLAACETARGQVSYGEGLVGMSWALLVAGSPTTVVSQWKVDAFSTSRLMRTFHRALLAADAGSPASRALALQQAALAVSRTSIWSHPFYWAPFVMIGDGF